MKNTLLMQFLKKPLTTGAVCASSYTLAQALIAGIGLDEAENVAELGPGTGAVTGSILAALSANSRFFAVELNREMIIAFRRRFPSVKVYNDSAVHLLELIKREDMEALDAVISGLPWAVFPSRLQEDILFAIASSLRPGGYFTTFAYLQGTILPRGRQFKKRLRTFFPSVERSPVVWSNFPPAFVYRCRK